VSVLEAQTRPGGRVRTLREPYPPGLYTEAGAESIPGVHDLTQHYARLFGLTLLPNSVPGTRTFYHVRGQRVSPSDAAAVWPFDLTDEERRLGRSGLFSRYVDEPGQQAMAAGYAQQPVRALSAGGIRTPGRMAAGEGRVGPAAQS
jgi:monoamine oxidase